MSKLPRSMPFSGIGLTPQTYVVEEWTMKPDQNGFEFRSISPLTDNPITAHRKLDEALDGWTALGYLIEPLEDIHQPDTWKIWERAEGKKIVPYGEVRIKATPRAS